MKVTGHNDVYWGLMLHDDTRLLVSRLYSVEWYDDW
jgi:hypothetical protein